MKQADQVAWLERMLAMARANTRDDAPGLTYTAVEEYFDKGRYDREVAVLFRRHPVVVGFSAQLRKPGDFVTNNDTGQSILVTRGLDGKLRAFLNVCRHRSATVETRACGRASAPSSARITAGVTISPASWSASPTAPGSARSIAARMACSRSPSRSAAAWSGSCRRRSRRARTPSSTSISISGR